jgi:folate-binding protein YgfZ
MKDKAFFELIPTRSVIAIDGEDRAAFMQGLITNDTARIDNDHAVYAALLTPQGKFAFDLMLVGQGDRYLIDAEAERRADLLKRLKMFKLRSKVSLDDLEAEFAVISFFGGDALARLNLAPTPGIARALDNGVVFTDPRLAELGARAFLPRATALQVAAELGFAEAAAGTFGRYRYALGVPENSVDLMPEKAIPLECGFDELNGIDWQKGCYMGQELTARTKYRGLVRKRLLPIQFHGASLPVGTPLLIDGKEVGEVRATQGDRGFALLRLEHLDAILAKGIDADGTHVAATRPAWVKLPEMV